MWRSAELEQWGVGRAEVLISCCATYVHPPSYVCVCHSDTICWADIRGSVEHNLVVRCSGRDDLCQVACNSHPQGIAVFKAWESRDAQGDLGDKGQRERIQKGDGMEGLAKVETSRWSSWEAPKQEWLS